MKKLIKGENASLKNLGVENTFFSVGVSWNLNGAQIDVDTSAFLIGENGKVTNERDFIFFNQPVSNCNSVFLKQDLVNSFDKSMFFVDTATLPDNIKSVMIVLTAEQFEKPVNFNQLDNVVIRIMSNYNEFVRYELSNVENESSIIMGEIYKHSDEWKFRAIGQGFNDGLGAMAQNFGIKITKQVELKTPPPKQRSKALAKKLNLFIQYQDASGNVSEREIMISSKSKVRYGYISAKCLMRNAYRSFLIYRIQSCIHCETGAHIDNVQKFIDDFYS